jgi:hypothetical protein
MTSRISIPTTFAALAALVLTAAWALSNSPASRTVQPNQISNLGVWLAASDLASQYRDGQPVTKWPDKSGNGYDAVYEPRIPQASLVTGKHNPPTFKKNALTSHPAVSFNADHRETLILNRAGHALGQKIPAFSAAFVVRPVLDYGPAPAPDVGWTTHRYLFITHVSNYDTRLSVIIMTGTGEVKLASRTQPKQKIDVASSFGDEGKIAVSGNAWHRLMVTVDYNTKTSRIVIDGKVLSRTLPATSLDMFEDVPNPITGIASNTLADWLTCQLTELICYQKALDADELKSLDAYFCDRYGLK